MSRAIKCFQQALLFYTPETVSHGYAMAQNNLGLIYAELSLEDQASNRTQAIECFQQALLFFTPEAEPLIYRIFTCNLADLYFTQGIWYAAFRTYRMAMNVGEQLYQVGLSTESAEPFLFPLHAAPLSGSASKLLCDCYQVSHAPSIEVLARIQARVGQRVKPELYAVIDPENNLPFTPFEGDAIARRCWANGYSSGTAKRSNMAPRCTSWRSRNMYRAVGSAVSPAEPEAERYPTQVEAPLSVPVQTKPGLASVCPSLLLGSVHSQWTVNSKPGRDSSGL